MSMSLRMKVTIPNLRRDYPGWSWKSKRTGFGTIEYYGTRNNETIRIHAVAVQCGPAEDDYATQWLVDDGEVSQTLSAWYLKHGPQ